MVIKSQATIESDAENSHRITIIRLLLVLLLPLPPLLLLLLLLLPQRFAHTWALGQCDAFAVMSNRNLPWTSASLLAASGALRLRNSTSLFADELRSSTTWSPNLAASAV